MVPLSKVTAIADTLIRERGRFRRVSSHALELVVPVRFEAEENHLIEAYGGRVTGDTPYRTRGGEVRSTRIWRLSRIPDLQRAIIASRTEWGRLAPQAALVRAWMRERGRGRRDPDAVEAWEAIWQ